MLADVSPEIQKLSAFAMLERLLKKLEDTGHGLDSENAKTVRNCLNRIPNIRIAERRDSIVIPDKAYNCVYTLTADAYALRMQLPNSKKYASGTIQELQNISEQYPPPAPQHQGLLAPQGVPDFSDDLEELIAEQQQFDDTWSTGAGSSTAAADQPTQPFGDPWAAGQQWAATGERVQLSSAPFAPEAGGAVDPAAPAGFQWSEAALQRVDPSVLQALDAAVTPQRVAAYQAALRAYQQSGTFNWSPHSGS